MIQSNRAASQRAAPGGAASLQSHLVDTRIAGRRLRYLDMGHGPPLLLVHGLGASWRIWAENVADLATDHRVIAVDLPGFGRSQALSAPTDIAHYADVLARLLDRIGVQRATVAGHSLGGVVVQRLAIGHPDRLDGLMLVSSGSLRLAARQTLAFYGLAASSAVLSRMAPLAYFAGPTLRVAMMVEPFRRHIAAHAVHDPTDFPSKYVAEMLAHAAFSPGFAVAMRAAMRPGIWDQADRIETRTLILSGESDRIVPVQAVKELSDRIPNASLELWSDVGHHPMLERPARFNERLRAYVRERTQSDGVPA
jgi:pimeloyl-ACP methyl ester carboxylesterase